MPSSPSDDSVRLFLSYAREDSDAISALYDRLEALGLHPWMDKVDILPGERWETKLSQAIRESHFFLACLSAKSVAKRGYLQREFKQALDLWQEKLSGDIYLIPVRLDECQVPETLSAFQWANLYEEDAWWALLRAIRAGAERQGLTIPQVLRDIPKRGRPVLKSGATPAAQPQRPDLLVITDPIRLELVRVPAGEFLMGSDRVTDEGAFDDEQPQHRLVLSEYYIGKCPVTVSQFAVFAQTQNYQTDAEREGYGWIWTGKEWQTEAGASWRHPNGPKIGVERKGDHPVTQLTWRDALAFCKWARMRLPSEAEWEKAARGVDGRLYPWGNQVPTVDVCNFNMNIGDTTPVDRYSQGASPYGALDMSGNVWEWTGSLYKPYPYNPNDVDYDDSGLGARIVRGGSFIGYVRLMRSAHRSKDIPNRRYSSIGFRVCAMRQ